jgi:putative hemolysin
VRHLRRRRAAGVTPAVSDQEAQIRRGLEALRDETARDVMTPRVDVVALATPVHYEDVAMAVRRSGHSHFPVYEEDLDRLVGVLFVKDLFHLGAPSAGIAPGLDVARRLRQPYLVPETRPVIELLAELRRNRRAFAVVVDEYGGVAGVVTIKDLVSTLVGDLRDEFDRTVSPSIHRVDRLRFLVDGACSVDEVRAALGMAVPDGEYVTLGGYLFDAFGHVPGEGETVSLQGWGLRVAKMDRRRIAKVVIVAPSQAAADAVTLSPTAPGDSATEGGRPGD